MTDPVNIYFGGELVIKRDELDPEVLRQIKGALTFVNEDKKKQETIGTFGWWDLPDVLPYYTEETRRGKGDVICLPRGFAGQLFTGLSSMGIKFETHVELSQSEAAPGYFEPFKLRGYQYDAVKAMLRAQQGVYKCPAGGGKTVSSLGLAAYANQRTLIVVDKANLLEQWRLRAAQFFNLETERDDEGKLFASVKGDRTVGKIGQNVWEERDLTICLRQTLWSRDWSLDATKWWANWGLVIFDECVTAETMISTPTGSRRIDDLAEGDEVLGVDHRTGQVITTTVKKTMRRPTTNHLLSVGGVLMTPNHPVWTLEGYVNAGDLPGDAIVLKYDHQTAGPASKDRAHLRGVLEAVQGEGEATILQSILCREVLRVEAGQPVQGDIGGGDPSETEDHATGFGASGWQRLEDAVGAVHDLGALRRDLGEDAQGRRKLLEDRRRARGGDAGDRSGRDDAQVAGAEGTRLQEGLGLAVARVDRGEGDEQGRDERVGVRSVQDQLVEVFNIETGTGNYFAGGVLTHNCHHLAADTTKSVASKMTSFYLFGISATPAKSPTKGKIVYSTVGDIVHETPRQLLYDEKVLMQPTIEPQYTELEEAFWVDHSVSDIQTCAVPDCDKNGQRHKHRNNYSSVVKALVNDKARNQQIIEYICDRPDGIHLVNSRQLKHLDLLEKELKRQEWGGSIYMLRGKENAEGMSQDIDEKMQEDARAGRGAVLFSTVAEEGMDIPPIDHVHVAFPGKDEGGLIQLVGRAERVFPTKTFAKVVDWRDMNTGCFASQAQERDRVYRMLGHRIVQTSYAPEPVA